MDKNAIKKYAVWARRELIEKISQKALQYGIEDGKELDPKLESINGVLLSDDEKKQRQALICKINENGYTHVMEEVAYTWFNRFIALRFMEVNGYLPSHVRVFTNDNNEFKPQIISEALSLEFEKIDKERVMEMKQANQDDDLYKYLLICQCNELNMILPKMFQKISDYTELLLPDYLLRNGSVLEQMISIVPQADWYDQVQIIGWMYQYYISDPKDMRINAHKKYVNGDISYVTQLFTSEWIVKYMVQNSLGRYWVDNHDSVLTEKWEYFLPEQERQKETKQKEVKPEAIRCIDPCCGSGHILAYMFDVFIEIYEEYGYSPREAAPLIVEKNIFALDIDERAAQLAYFSIMMKARQYDRRFFSKGIQPNVYAINDCELIDSQMIEYYSNGNEELRKAITSIIEELNEASVRGSLIKVKDEKWEELLIRLDETSNDMPIFRDVIVNEMTPILKVAQVLSGKYQIVVTNPPYMNASLMPEGLKNYVQENYYDFRGDLFSAFAKRVIDFCDEDGHIGMLMPYVWMFIASYEKMRDFLNDTVSITSLVQLEYNAFEAACVPVAALTARKSRIHTYGEYIKLSEFRGSDNQAPKTIEAVKNSKCGYRYTSSQDDFMKLPGKIFAFWASESVIESFSENPLGSILVTREGMATADNDRFLRLWSEVNITKIGFSCKSKEEATLYKWFPYNKGGDYRKWYGNNDYVVDWENDGERIRNNKDPKTGRIRSHNYNGDFAFKKGITWSALSSSSISVRYAKDGFLFDSKGAKGFCENDEDLLYSLALINSKVGLNYLSFISPTIDFKVGDIIQIPLIYGKVPEIVSMAKRCIEISKEDWDSFETSWDFKRHPLAHGTLVEEEFVKWKSKCENRFNELKNLEEMINKAFIETYGLTEELDPSVKDGEIVIRTADRERDIKSLISYVVGIMFGRFSLDQDGVIYAGGPWDDSAFVSFKPDVDNIIPICNDEYFEDDIVNRFVKIIEIIYGKETLTENLKYISETIGGKGSPKEIIRDYFLNDFYKDHCSIYAVTGSGKRPIYWMFNSGKKNGFKCIIYIHRYKPDNVARIRTDYVHELQSRYRTALEEIEKNIPNASQSDRVKLSKRMKEIQEQYDEVHGFEEKIHHLADQMLKIDLDDGFKNNYNLFDGVVEKVK